MEDLGDTQYLSLLKTGRGVDKLYGDALTTLANIQVRGLRAAAALEPYDRAPLERELNLMPEWFLGKHLRLELTPEERALLTVTNEFLINEALLQPQVLRSSRLPLAQSHGAAPVPTDNVVPGVIDFQDALRGPDRLRPRVAAQGLLHQLVARARRALGTRLSPRARQSRRERRRQRIPVHALVRSHRRAAARQGAGHLRAAVASRRQDRLSRRPAAGA